MKIILDLDNKIVKITGSVRSAEELRELQNSLADIGQATFGSDAMIAAYEDEDDMNENMDDATVH